MLIREQRGARLSEEELGERTRSDPLKWKIAQGDANRNYSIPRKDRPAPVPRVSFERPLPHEWGQDSKS